MRKFLLVLVLIFGKLFFGISQDFKDTIITNEFDTIICEITLVNNYNIFYKYNPKKKRIKDSYISRSTVLYFSIRDNKVTVMNEEEKPKEQINSLKEENGIIFPSIYESAPYFQKGLHDLYCFIESQTRVYSRDLQVFKDQSAVVLFSIRIDSLGFVQEVNIKESSSQTGGFDYKSKYLEDELKRVIHSTNKWNTAVIDGKPVSSFIYLPLKFHLEGNRVVLRPSSFLFLFKNRD